MLVNGLSKSAKVSDGLLPASWRHHCMATMYGYHRKLFIPVSTCPSRSAARDDKSEETAGPFGKLRAGPSTRTRYGTLRSATAALRGAPRARPRSGRQMETPARILARAKTGVDGHRLFGSPCRLLRLRAF